MKKNRIYRFKFPLGRPHLGVPLGNGGFGALVWGKESRLNITVSRNDFWDRRNGQVLRDNGVSYKKICAAYAAGEFDKVRELYASCAVVKDGNFPSTVLPCGRFEFPLRSGESLKEAELDIKTGALKIKTSSGKSLSMRLSMSAGILRIEDKDRLLTAAECRPAWRGLEEKFKERLFDPPVTVSEKNLSGWLQSCPADPSLAALCEKTADGFLVSLKLGRDNSAARENALSVIKDFKRREKDIATEDAAFWRKYWSGTPKTDIPSEFLDKFTPFALYRFACAANPAAEKPCPLQGPWIEDYQFPPWGGNYTVNVNIEQIYTLALPIGKPEFLEPLFRMLESGPFVKAMSGNARAMFGIDDGYLLTHSVNDLGMQCQNGFSTHSALDHAVTAWMSQLYWLCYKYTLDKDFLRDRAYPFMTRVMRVYEEMTAEYNGRLSIPLAPSPEYGVTGARFNRGGRNIQEGRDPSAQLACAHWLADALIEAAGILGETPREKWLDIKKRLPLCTLFDDPGEKRIAIWEGQDLDQCHRHHMHLCSIYPFDSLGEMTPEKEEILNNTLNHWIEKGMGEWSEWGMPWAAIIQARAGLAESPSVLLELWKEIFVNDSLCSVYLPKYRGVSAHRKKDIPVPRGKNEIFQIEGTMAAATAVYEMLAHIHSGVLKIFPAVPEKWRDVSFAGLRLPGALVVSGKKRDGEITEVTVKNGPRPLKIKTDIHGAAQMTLTQGGKSALFSVPGVLEMKPGEKVTLKKVERLT
jgi:alpha-L-fucosidase 2